MLVKPSRVAGKVLRVLFLFAIAVVLLEIGIAVRERMRTKSAQAAALAKARIVHGHLSRFAFDEDGIFPIGSVDSNSAFRMLFDRHYYPELEDAFDVAGSSFHHKIPSGEFGPPDCDVSDGRKLVLNEGGDNHWAYVNGLTLDSGDQLPIVADGFSLVPGVYSADKNHRGGLWEGKAAIVIRVDGSGKIEKPDSRDGRVYEEVRDKDVDIFSYDYLPATSEVLNPL